MSVVSFKIADVYHPEPDQLLRQLHGKDLLQGVVIDTSDGTPPQGSFVVVQVEGLNAPVIVPTNCVLEVH